MFQGTSVGASEGTESAGRWEKWAGSLPRRLSFVVSAFITAQGMIRFSDETASFVFLFSGIILSIFGIRGDRILLILGGQVRPGVSGGLWRASSPGWG